MSSPSVVSRIRPHILPTFVLLVVTVMVYWSVLGHEFLLNWDDSRYVTDNPAVRGLTWEHTQTAFSTFYVGNYAPLQIVSYMLDYSLWGMKSAGFHGTNLFIHAINGLLFYLLVMRFHADRIWAFTASALFLLHPVQVESVAWISQRKNLLAMLFFLAAFLSYDRFKRRNADEGWLWYSLSILSFTAALLTKSVAVIFPLVLILYDYCFRQQTEWKRVLAEKMPYLFAACIVAALSLVSQSPEYEGGRTSFHGGSPFATFLTMIPVVVRYLSMVVWPADLSAVYSPPVKTGLDFEVIAASGAIAVVTVVALVLFRRRRDLFFWGGLFFIGLLPVSQIIPLVTLMNDRYLYFPMLGGAALFGWGVAGLLNNSSGWQKRMIWFLTGVVLVSFSVATMKRIPVWKNSLSLWSDAVRKTPGNAQAWFALGDTYNQVGKLDEALAYYRKSLAVNPNHKNALNNIGLLYLRKGELETALTYFDRLVKNYPDFLEAYINRGGCYYLKGDFRRSVSDYDRALELQPSNAQVMVYRGNAFLQLADRAMARGSFLGALQASGAESEALYGLASVDALEGDLSGAMKNLESAVKAGFNDFARISRSPDFTTLRELPEFDLLLQRHKHK